MTSLPEFPYHPDPVATGSISASEEVCLCCGQARGFIYTGAVYAVDELDDGLCPWCIAGGSAHEMFDASFTDEAAIGGGEWDDIPAAAVEQVSYRTPGFSGWQQERWWTHCGDAAMFVGRVGRAELDALGIEASEAIRIDTGLDGAKWDAFRAALKKEGSPTGYLFRCRHCGTIGGYQDAA